MPAGRWFSLRQFLIQTDDSLHKILPISFMYILSFFKNILCKTQIVQNPCQNLTTNFNIIRQDYDNKKDGIFLEFLFTTLSDFLV